MTELTVPLAELAGWEATPIWDEMVEEYSDPTERDDEDDDHADMDEDGDLDVLSASYEDDTVAWYENTAGDGSAWTAHSITTEAIGATSVYCVDVDGDGVITDTETSPDLKSASLLFVTLENVNFFVGMGGVFNADRSINTDNAIGFSIAGAGFELAMVKPMEATPPPAEPDKTSYLGLELTLDYAGLVGLEDDP